ncbi:MAG: PleD family two-component system response regulator [Candidatus Hodarchaeota archaeon]
MKPRILVVEDDKNIIFNISLILLTNDYEPIVAKNGQEALELLSKLDLPPDLILSNTKMPKMDGYTLYQNITRNPKYNHIPFIFVLQNLPQMI